MIRLKVLYQVPVSMTRKLLNGIVRNLNLIAVLIEVLFPILLIWLNMSLQESILFSLLFVFIVHYIKNVSNELNSTNTRGMPVPRIRFTKKDGDMVTMEDETNLAELLIYMNELEEYLKVKGLVRYND